MMISSNSFRLYDIRGMVADELPLCQMYFLAHAIAAHIIEKNPSARKIIIGRDGRTHSQAIQKEVVRAFFDAGFSVDDTGVCPTPVIYFATHVYDYDAALMITASHNGPEYNGIKICLGRRSLWGESIKDIEKGYRAGVKVSGLGSGLYKRVALQQEYIAYMAHAFSDLKDVSMSLIADCGNGAVGSLLRDTIDAVGLKDVLIMCEEVDGTYPNHNADPTHAENMAHVIEKVMTHKVDFAIGFDGDGDRMAAITHKGTLLAGDQLLALFVRDILSHHPGETIVFDSKCLLIVPETIKKYGGNPFRAPSGHSLIKNAMREQHAIFAGELSCHFFFADDYFGYDDGIYTFFRLIRMVYRSGKTLAELSDDFVPTYNIPEVRIFCDDAQKNNIIELIGNFLKHDNRYTCSFDDGVRFECEAGWGLIRVSHTQPALCVRCESITQTGLEELKKTLRDVLHRAFMHMSLPYNTTQEKEYFL